MNLTYEYGGVVTIVLYIFYSLRGYIWAQADRQEASDTVWKTPGIGDKKWVYFMSQDICHQK